MATVELSRKEATKEDLPLVCVCCGEAASAFHPVALYGRNLGKVRGPLCNLHQNHWRWRTIVVWSSCVTTCLCLLFGCLLLPNETLAGFNGIGLFLWVLGMLLAPFNLVIFLVVFFTAVRVTLATKTTLTLVGVAPEFVEALRVYRQAKATNLPPAPAPSWPTDPLVAHGEIILRVQSSSTLEDMVAASAHEFMRSKTGRAQRWNDSLVGMIVYGLLVGLLLYVVVPELTIFPGETRHLKAILIGVLVVLVVGSIPFSNYGAALKRRMRPYLREKLGDGPFPCQVEIASKGLLVTQDTCQSIYWWSSIEPLQETPEWVKIIVRGSVILVRKRAFETPTKLQEFLETVHFYMEKSRKPPEAEHVTKLQEVAFFDAESKKRMKPTDN